MATAVSKGSSYLLAEEEETSANSSECVITFHSHFNCAVTLEPEITAEWMVMKRKEAKVKSMNKKKLDSLTSYTIKLDLPKYGS